MQTNHHNSIFRYENTLSYFFKQIIYRYIYNKCFFFENKFTLYKQNENKIKFSFDLIKLDDYSNVQIKILYFLFYFTS